MKLIIRVLSCCTFAISGVGLCQEPSAEVVNPTEIKSAAQISTLLVQSCKANQKCASITVFDGDRGTVPSAPPASKTPPSSVELKKRLLNEKKN